MDGLDVVYPQSHTLHSQRLYDMNVNLSKNPTRLEYESFFYVLFWPT